MTVALYRSQSQYTIANLGQSTRTGGSLRFAFPFFGAHWTRLGVTYGAEAVRYGGTGLLATVTTNDCAGCLRSTLGFDLTRDTRIEMPFATDGSLQSFQSQFNGGPLGGTASFQRYTSEFKSYATLATIGGEKGSPNGMKLVVGLTQRGGMVFGNAGPFFSTQEFAMGGVQYGEQLRGYPEFSITPLGFNPNTSTSNAVLSVVRQRVLQHHRGTRASHQLAVLRRTCSSTPATSGRIRGTSIPRGCSAAPASASAPSRRSVLSGSTGRTASTGWMRSAIPIRSSCCISVSVRSSTKSSEFPCPRSFVRWSAQHQSSSSCAAAPLSAQSAPAPQRFAYVDTRLILDQAPGPRRSGGACCRRNPSCGTPRSRRCRTS